MKILIASGIYPPQIGGPAEYAKNLKRTWEESGHTVAVKHFSFEYKLPIGLRHFYFFLKIIPAVAKSDVVFILDTLSAGAPAMLAAKIFRKKTVIRTGGDFLWESYVERTGELVPLRNFYREKLANLSFKEKLIFRITRWVFKNAKCVVWSTDWQRKIFTEPYDIDLEKTMIIENYYGKKEAEETPSANGNKIFIAGVRNLKWKNLPLLEKAFAEAKKEAPEIILDKENAPYEKFMEKIRRSYAVILVSLGDISPNMILDAIRLNKPFILTKENGLQDRIGDLGLAVDPFDEKDIKEKILWLNKPENYQLALEKIKMFKFTHGWEEIGREFINLFQAI